MQVVDRQLVTGLPDGSEDHSLFVYHVDPDGRIARVELISSQAKLLLHCNFNCDISTN
jgi:hypothetical protein